jgi:acyl-CoA thioester hydrolase
MGMSNSPLASGANTHYFLPVTGQVFRHSRRVTYSDCTVGNHVYYGRYLEILEEARSEFFRHLGLPLFDWQQQGVIFPVVECHVRYQGAARYDDVLAVETWLTELARVRFLLAYRIVDQGQRHILRASTLHACTDVNDKLRRIPPDLAERLRPYCHELTA